jgi:hypothetical protein
LKDAALNNIVVAHPGYETVIGDPGNLHIDGNLYYHPDRSPKFRYNNQEFTGLASYQSALAGAGSIIGKEANSVEGDPQFENMPWTPVGDYFDDGWDVSIKSTSPAFAAAVPLAYTVGSGSGTVVTVDDAKFFYDGYGIETGGDYIKVGLNSVVQITAVNEDANTLTVSSNISWSNNDSIIICSSSGVPFDSIGCAQPTSFTLFDGSDLDPAQRDDIRNRYGLIGYENFNTSAIPYPSGTDWQEDDLPGTASTDFRSRMFNNGGTSGLVTSSYNGTPAMKFFVPGGSTTAFRSQLTTQGADRWNTNWDGIHHFVGYKFLVENFPYNDTAPANATYFMDLHQVTNDPPDGEDWSGILGFKTYPDGRLHLAQERFSLPNPPDVFFTGEYTHLQQIENQWTDFVMEWLCTASTNGFIKIWINDKLVCEYNGQTYDPNATYFGYYKFGLYPSYHKWDGLTAQDKTMYIDDIRIADAAQGGTYHSVRP